MSDTELTPMTEPVRRLEIFTGSGELGFASVVVAPSTIEIDLAGMTIRVPPGSDASTLRAVLQAAKAVA